MKLEKLLRGAIKIAAVALTSPATWAVAGNLYTSPIQRVIVQLAALVLVEAALLLGWHMLDHSSRATSAQRMLYAVLTVTAYSVLWAVAIAHGEGLAGIGFRATLGVLIGYSVIESGLLAGIKLRQQADRDISRHWKVKRYRRKLAIKTEKTAANAEFEISDKEIELDKQRQLAALAVERPFQSKSVHIEDVQKSRVHRQRSSKQAAVDKTLDMLRDDPNASIRTLAQAVDRSRSTVSNYLRELERSGQISRNGTGVKVLTD
jgi:hypothetical protein